MHITPDDLSARFAPPLTGGILESRAAEFTFNAYQLAEAAVTALPRGHHLDQAVAAIESAAHWVTAGLATLAADEAAETDADTAVPYALGAPLAETNTVALTLDTAMWRLGLRGSMLHPLVRLVGQCLSEAADATGYIADSEQPTVEDLCLASGLCTTDVLRCVEDLCGASWISRHTDGGLTRYQLRLPIPAQPERPTS